MQKLLLIDADPATHARVRRLLEELADRGESYALAEARSPKEGLRALRRRGVDLCLMAFDPDSEPPGAFLEAARALEGGVPLVFLVERADRRVDTLALEAGALDCLEKGELTARVLGRSIRYVLRLERTLRQLRELAIHDELTGLINRRAAERVLRDELERCVRFGHSFALVMVDLDHFKAVNDTHGHPVGDAVLRHAASLLRGQVRAGDQVARYGGEEFAIVLVGCDREGGLDLAKRLCELLPELPYTLPDGGVIQLTLSAGVAAAPVDATSAGDLIAAADRALYRAKAGGRNRVCGA